MYSSTFIGSHFAWSLLDISIRVYPLSEKGHNWWLVFIDLLWKEWGPLVVCVFTPRAASTRNLSVLSGIVVRPQNWSRLYLLAAAAFHLLLHWSLKGEGLHQGHYLLFYSLLIVKLVVSWASKGACRTENHRRCSPFAICQGTLFDPFSFADKPNIFGDLTPHIQLIHFP